MRMKDSVYCSWLASVGCDDVEERLSLLIDDGVAGPLECAGQIGGLLDALGMRALRARHLVVWRCRREFGEHVAVSLASDALLEHRQRSATHGAVAAVVEDDGEDRQPVHLRHPLADGR